MQTVYLNLNYFSPKIFFQKPTKFCIKSKFEILINLVGLRIWTRPNEERKNENEEKNEEKNCVKRTKFIAILRWRPPPPLTYLCLECTVSSIKNIFGLEYLCLSVIQCISKVKTLVPHMSVHKAHTL